MCQLQHLPPSLSQVENGSMVYESKMTLIISHADTPTIFHGSYANEKTILVIGLRMVP